MSIPVTITTESPNKVAILRKEFTAAESKFSGGQHFPTRATKIKAKSTVTTVAATAEKQQTMMEHDVDAAVKNQSKIQHTQQRSNTAVTGIASAAANNSFTSGSKMRASCADIDNNSNTSTTSLSSSLLRESEIAYTTNAKATEIETETETQTAVLTAVPALAPAPTAAAVAAPIVLPKSGAYASTLIVRNTIQPTMPTGAAVLSVEPSSLNQSKRRYESVWLSNSSSTPSFTLLEQQQQQHLINKSDKNAFVSKESVSTDITTTTATSATAATTRPTFCIGRISKNLQNNQFIKNQQQQQQEHNLTNTSGFTYATASASAASASNSTVTNKLKIFRTNSASQDTTTITAVSNSGLTTASTSISSTSTFASPTKTTAKEQQPNNINIPPTTTVGVGNCKKKMVALQESKKTTPKHVNQQQQQQHHHQEQEAQERITAEMISNDFNGCEDLSYGPGIVSKLRFRYLHLAARQKADKENAGILDLRRSTSLNNLLDREQKTKVINTCIVADEEEEDVYDEEEAEEEDEATITADRCLNLKQEQLKNSQNVTTGNKSKTLGILKRSNFETTQTTTTTSVVWKKTTSFDVQYIKNNEDETAGINGNCNAALNGNASALRSRQLKRGNDSLKRARSVEALLSERTPWNYGMLKSPTNSNNPTVSIEDKINKARVRLLSGTDSMPPKRLTSIIDDTERPPADLVKHTLRIFEASANRRGRTTRNANVKGEVANKVANYKSIINEQKPAILHPKPAAATQSAPSKKVLNKAALISVSPTAAAAPTMLSPTMTSTPKANNNATGTATTTNTKSLIHRQKQLLLERQNESYSTTTHAKFSSADSPITALTKRLDKLNLETSAKSAVESSKDVEYFGTGTGTDTGTSTSTGAGVASDVLTHNNNININNADKNADRSENVVKKEQKYENNVVDVHDDDNNDNDNDNTDNECISNNEVNNDNKSDRNDYYNNENDGDGDDDDDEGGNDKGSDNVNVDYSLQQSGINASANSSNDFSAVEYGGAATAGITNKRVTKSVLDKIAKAGTTQQFKFFNESVTTATATTTPTAESTNLVIKAKTIANCMSPIPTTQQQQQQQQQDLQSATNIEIAAVVLNASPNKQIGIIRPILTSQTQRNQQQTQQLRYMETLKQQQSNSCSGSSSSSSSTHSKVSSCVVGGGGGVATLTSREIEKNRINEMKKNDVFSLDNSNAAAENTTATAAATTTTTTTSLDNNVITDKKSTTETDATAAAASSNCPIWAQRKRRQVPAPIPENNTMVFNFSNRKEVPDYIENDGVTFRRKRELPKPNESGFVILHDDISSSTDTDFDDFSMCPPSPCDVEFENANIVIDGKSSIRQKSKEATFRVQFNDTLTSTFEYPSEASLVIEETSYRNEHYLMAIDQLEQYVEHMSFDESDGQILKHHHVKVDEIIPLPTSNAASAAAATSSSEQLQSTKSVLGSLPLGSAPLGLYSPLKAPLDNSFQLGVTRAGTATTTTTKINSSGNGSIVGISGGLLANDDCGNGASGQSMEPDSLQYLKPASDDLTVAYSEGANKTDLLY